MKNFDDQREMVEQFMKNLIEHMTAYDRRFSGNLLIRGSAYEETIADTRGDFDYMLDIDGLSSVCTPKEGTNDPPGFVRLQLIPEVDFVCFFHQCNVCTSSTFPMDVKSL